MSLDRQLQLLTEIRDLLKIIAEPQLAVKEKEAREKLVQIVGRSDKRRKAALLIDGLRTRAAIQKESGIDQADLSRFMAAIKTEGIGEEVDRIPKLFATVNDSMFGG